MIQLSDALEQMEQVNRRGFAVPFSIEVVSYDKKRDTAGDVKSYENAVLCTNKVVNKVWKSTPTKKVTTTKPVQNHWRNATRNIQLPNGEVKTIHIWLIRKFNNQKVVWNING
jgi:hypothetical protein